MFDSMMSNASAVPALPPLLAEDRRIARSVNPYFQISINITEKTQGNHHSNSKVYSHFTKGSITSLNMSQFLTFIQ